MKREDAEIQEWDRSADEFKAFVRPRLYKEELATLHVRYLTKVRDKGMRFKNKNSYVLFITPNNLPKTASFTAGEYGVKVEDFLEVLASMPHVPNKKEARIMRQLKTR